MMVRMHSAAPLGGNFAAAVATLPSLFDGHGQVVTVIDGRGPHWPGEAAEAQKPVVVAEPRMVEGAIASHIILDLPWAGRIEAREAVDVSGATLVLAEFTLCPTDDRTLEDAVADVLTLVARVGDGALALDVLRMTGSAVVASGAVGSAILQLSGVRSASSASGARVSFRSPERLVDLQLPGPGAAWPGTVAVTDHSGRTTRPTAYEHHTRTSLRLASADGCVTEDARHYTAARAALHSVRVRH